VKPKPNSFLNTRSATLTEENTRFLNFELDRATVDAKARTAALSFSSEFPVERWFGQEVLDHAPTAVRLGRLNNGGALLMDHDRNDQIGVVESATIDPKTKKGRAIVRFGKSARAEEIFQDVMDGIRRLVSVGYRIHKTETESKSGGVEVVRVTDWEPFEISIVSIPADDSVGVGRGAVSPAPKKLPFKKMEPETVIETPAPAAQRAAEHLAPAAPVVAVRGDDGLAQETARIDALRTIGTRAASVNITLDVERAIADGSAPSVMQERLNSALIARNTPYAPPAVSGPSRSEQRDLAQFSMARGIQQLASRAGLSGIEKEMHEEGRREALGAGLALRGEFSVPSIALGSGRRDMTATGGTSGDQGGNTILTTFGPFIDLLYKKMVLRGLGAQFITGLTGNFELPKLLTGTAPAKLAENGASGESSPTTGVVRFTPKRAGRYVEYSKQLIAQSALAWEPILRNDLATMLAIVMETGAINGGGSDEPTGILNTSGIGSVAGGTNGLALTRANAIKLKTAVAAADADMGSLGFLTNPAVRGKAQETAIDAGSGLFLWKEEQDDRFMGYAAGVTNVVPSNLVKGTSGTTCSALIFGNFADLVIAQWGGIDIQVNPYIKDTEGLVRITADCYYDAGVRRAASFAAIKDLLTV
jgi:HK97 family phage major capsid protein